MKNLQDKHKNTDCMLLYNNQRTRRGLPLHRKKNGKARICTRREVEETIEAFIDYCYR